VTEPAATPRVVREWVTITDPTTTTSSTPSTCRSCCRDTGASTGRAARASPRGTEPRPRVLPTRRLPQRGRRPATNCNASSWRNSTRRCSSTQGGEEGLRRGTRTRSGTPGAWTGRASSSTGTGSRAGPGVRCTGSPSERGEHHMTYKPVVVLATAAAPHSRPSARQRRRDRRGPHDRRVRARPLGRGRVPTSTGTAPRTRPRSSATDPVYEDMEYELREMVGNAVYDALAAHLDQRRKQRGRGPVPPGRELIPEIAAGRPRSGRARRRPRRAAPRRDVTVREPFRTASATWSTSSQRGSTSRRQLAGCATVGEVGHADAEQADPHPLEPQALEQLDRVARHVVRAVGGGSSVTDR
jgi:hypothetical protein